MAAAEGVENDANSEGWNMKIASMKFDNSNNSSLCLQVIAELVRRGDMKVEVTRHDEAPKWVRIEVYDLRERG